MSFEDIFSSKGRVKVLKVILLHGEINITSIIRETGLNYTLVTKHINYLKSCNIIEEIVLGRVKIYRPNWVNPRVRYIDEMLRTLNGELNN
ncbi:MAG: winged helix-turn-helix domain-containing protein [Sulfolobales archaeon]